MSNYCFVAAKSAGHILPALALARKLKHNDSNTYITFISTTTSLDNKLLTINELVDKHIPLALTNIPYRTPWLLPVFVIQLLRSFAKSYRALHRTRTARIITTGGLIAIPVCFAGWLHGIPVDLYELNAQPGRAIAWLSHLATTVYYCFDQAAPHLPLNKQCQTEYPLLASIDCPSKQHAQLGLDPTKKTVFILGGSQGSRSISHTIKNILSQEHTLATSINIIHQVGNNNPMVWRQWYAQHGIPAYVFDYEPTCIPYYKLADTVICRSGSGTLHELVAIGKKCITIPLEASSTKHQIANAAAMQKKYPDLVHVIRQHESTLLKKEIIKLLAQEDSCHFADFQQVAGPF